ncbi:MAG: formyltransferase family protein [Holophagaceae bacterium]
MRVLLAADGALAAPLLASLAGAGHLHGAAWGAADPACRDWVRQACAAAGAAFLAADGPASLAGWGSAADADVALAFGWPWKIPPPLREAPRWGWINLHGGALPGFRGPQPLFWQLREGAESAQLVAHLMDGGLDTGPVLASLPVGFGPRPTHGSASRALAQAAPALAGAVLDTLSREGAAALARATPQAGEARIRPRPGMEDVRIAWDRMGADQVDALVRACNPWNLGAWTALEGEPCRLLETSPLGALDGAPGTVRPLGDGGLAVACRDGRGLRLGLLRLEDGFYSGARLRELGLGGGARFA